MSFLFSQPAPGVLPPDSVSFDELAEVAANSIVGNPTGSQANAVSINSNLFFVDSSTNRIGIGSISPNAKLQVNNSGTQLGLSVYSTSTNNTAELYNQGTTNYTLALNSAANSAYTGASIGGYFARGTLSSRAQTLANDSLLSISASGHTGTAVAGISAAIVLAADENTEASAYGGQIVFATQSNNSVAPLPTERLIIKNDGKVIVTGLTASQLIATDASKNLQSLPTATYPSLTELSYVKGVTSALQTQLNGKVDSVSGSAPISSSGGTTPTISVSDFTQATSLLAGTRGTVPAPQAGDQVKFLRGDATWATAGISTAGALDQQVLAYDSGTGSTTWQYAGLGDGSFGTNNIILGRGKPGTLSSGTDNVLIGSSAGSTISTATNCFLVNTNGRAANESYEININGYLRVQPAYFSAIGIGHTNALNPFVVSIGSGAGSGAGNRSVSIGRNSGISAGNSAISIGDGAGGGNGGGAGGSGVISIGAGSHQYNGSINSIAIGTLAAQGASPSGSGYNTIIGSYSGYNLNLGAYNASLGAYSLYTSSSKNNCVGIGAYAGYNSNTSNEFYLDSRSSALASNALEKTNSLMYGVFNATAASQTLTINATTTSTYGYLTELGTVSAPTYSFTGNTNTGIWSSAADTLNISTGGSERLRVDSSGNVGIGTTSPTAKLEVNGNILATEVAVANYKLHPVSHSHTQNSNAAHNINWATAPIEILTLNANITSLTFSNVVEGGAYLIKIVQGASGGPYTISWPTIKWLGGAPTLSTAANAVDVVSLTYVGGEYLAVASVGFV